jgi:hypothetical protein
MTETIEPDLVELPEISADAEHCNGRRESKTKYCTRPPGWGTDHVGEGRCKLHGGKSLKGSDSPRFKHGRYSKYSKLPGYLVDAYEKNLSDPDLMNMENEIALLESLADYELSKLNSHKESDYWYTELNKAFLRLDQQVNAQSIDQDKAIDALETLKEVLYGAQDEREAHKEVRTIVDQVKRTKEAETRRKVALQGVITVERVLYFANAVVGIIKDKIPDPKLQGTIATEIKKLLPSKSEGG